MYPRYSETLLKELLDEFRILYLTGPRQAGKTTLARKIAKDLGMLYISLDEQTVLASAQSDPHGFIDNFSGKPIILDEFQMVPELIPAIKLVSDQLQPHERGRFFLTGSADIFNSGKTQEALPGHMARIELYPLSVTEMVGSNFNLIDWLCSDSLQLDSWPTISRKQIAQTLINGGYPELQSKSPRARVIWFNSYLQGRLLKDFESIYNARGDYYTKLKTLIPYLAGLSGNLLKYASIANDLGQNDKVIKSYLEVLEWMFIVKRIYPFVKNSAKRQTIGMPKLQMIDTGLACYLLGLNKTSQLLNSKFYGGLLENWVVMEFFKHLGWAEEAMNIYHFRDRQQNEVDLILEQADGHLIGIEVKASSTVRDSDFNGLRKLSELVGKRLKYGLVFYTGSIFLPFYHEESAYYAIPLSVLWSDY